MAQNCRSVPGGGLRAAGATCASAAGGGPVGWLEVSQQPETVATDRKGDSRCEWGELEAYRQLTARASQNGYRVNKVVYRGYAAPDRLQAMHDQAIESRTRLQLERMGDTVLEQAPRLRRAGMTGLPGRNTRLVRGGPMMSYPLRAASGSGSVERLYVSADSPEIAAIGREHGAEIIDRPPELCTPEALGEDAYRHGFEVIRDQLAGAGHELALLIPPFPNAPPVTAALLAQGRQTETVREYRLQQIIFVIPGEASTAVVNQRRSEAVAM